LRTANITACFLLLAGCALNPPLDEAKRLIDAGQLEEGLARAEQVLRENPTNAEYRSYLARQRELALSRMLAQAEHLRASGSHEQADTAYRRILRFEPKHERALSAIAQLDAERRAQALLKTAEQAFKRGDLAGARQGVQTVLAENPTHRGARTLLRQLEEQQMAMTKPRPNQLGPEFAKPISLEFREANLRQVFEIIARSHGVNFVFDKDVRSDTRVTIFVRNTSIDDVIKLILATNQLERKVLSPNSLLIYPNTPAKAKEYVELVTRSFYLSNADAKQALNMIRTLVKTRDVFIDEKLNLLIMRDTPDAVRYAEQLVLAQDLAEPEVMLDLEVLEVNRSRLQELGIRFPEQVRFGPLGVDGAAPPAQFEFSTSQLQAAVTNPAFVLNLKLQEGLTNVLANPRIRVRNREKARIHVGEKVPVVTTTSTANVGVSASVSYLDVGLKLDVEPNVYLHDEIAIKVGLEVSSILETLTIQNVLAYRLGARNAMTTLRLRDGETQVLAGLISDEDRRAANKVPGLGELPLLGRLFSSSNDTRNKGEIVLLITPRVVRNLDRPDARLAEIASGTESAIGRPFAIQSPVSGAVKLTSVERGAPKPASVAPKPVEAPPAPPVASLALSAPPQAALGAQFNLSIALSGQAQRARFDIVFDPSVLQPLDTSNAGAPAPSDKPASTVSAIELGADSGGAARELRFRVIASQPGATVLTLQNAVAFDAQNGPVALTAPGPHKLALVLQ
jgi:general secretion pathway protein D